MSMILLQPHSQPPSIFSKSAWAGSTHHTVDDDELMDDVSHGGLVQSICSGWWFWHWGWDHGQCHGGCPWCYWWLGKDVCKCLPSKQILSTWRVCSCYNSWISSVSDRRTDGAVDGPTLVLRLRRSRCTPWRKPRAHSPKISRLWYFRLLAWRVKLCARKSRVTTRKNTTTLPGYTQQFQHPKATSKGNIQQNKLLAGREGSQYNCE